MYELRDIATRSERRQHEALLRSAGLEMEDADIKVGLFDDDGGLAACGSASGAVIKNLAVRPDLAGEGLASRIATELVCQIKSSGPRPVFVFTKPSNTAIFRSLGFHLLASTSKAALFEDRAGGVAAFLSALPPCDGALVANANPFTNGHLHLVRLAASRSKRLLLLIVEEDASLFSTEERLDMARGALQESGLANVVLAKGGPYVISKKTFPTYFLKKADDKNLVHAELDAALFASRIAPPLGIRRRFVGEEPLDAATAQYNAVLERVLPPSGVEVAVCPRLEAGGRPLSASQVRELFEAGDLAALRPLVPPFGYKYLLALRLADLAGRSLLEEARTTPKPGLVDRANNGSHNDMDLPMLERSARAIAPYFRRMATWALVHQASRMERGLPDEVRAIGIEAEAAMMRATGGVNTHKGAIFSLGSVLHCASVALAGGLDLSPRSLLALCRVCFEGLTDELSGGPSSHGKTVYQRYRKGGAREEAQKGFPSALRGLDYLRGLPSSMDKGERLAWTGVFLVSILEDSNIYYRSSAATALWAREEARRTLGMAGNGTAPIAALDRLFIERNISPGGAADMLALVWFLDAAEPLLSGSSPSDGRL